MCKKTSDLVENGFPKDDDNDNSNDNPNDKDDDKYAEKRTNSTAFLQQALEWIGHTMMTSIGVIWQIVMTGENVITWCLLCMTTPDGNANR